MLLGVNIDHIAVLREAREINDPNPLDALGIVQRAGGDQITIHLREDRRHIQDEDAKLITKLSPLPVNIECAIAPSVTKIVRDLNPNRVTLVPEKREEVTTEGGLDLDKNYEKIKQSIDYFQEKNIELSLFIDPKIEYVKASKELGAEWIELHTGLYSNIYAMLYSNLRQTHHCIKALELDKNELSLLLVKSLNEIKECAIMAKKLGLKVAAGHGLNYQNVKNIAKIDEIEELNIGQSIVARSVFNGLEEAVKTMKSLIN
ncbi:MAG: pyridoxine 5'-phosphate synthase [Sulfurospirillaceae bacterium]|jgi:pyridoxine 5-phosphate synthase|nr:pyridoxine 5'-phosphate synthase [Sulfurospirillaceae bacterium]MCK9546519.1 pyridoxine 5'-phosphate synthase [Sulfurospirillaceae bacterium]